MNGLSNLYDRFRDRTRRTYDKTIAHGVVYSMGAQAWVNAIANSNAVLSLFADKKRIRTMEDARADARKLLREARAKLLSGQRFTKGDMKSVLLKVLEALDNVDDPATASTVDRKDDVARNSVPYLVGVYFDGNSGNTYEYLSKKLVFVGERVFVNSPYTGLTCVTVRSVKPMFTQVSRVFTLKWLIDDVEQFKREQQEIQREQKRRDLANRQALLTKQLDAVNEELLKL